MGEIESKSNLFDKISELILNHNNTGYNVIQQLNKLSKFCSILATSDKYATTAQLWSGKDAQQSLGKLHIVPQRIQVIGLGGVSVSAWHRLLTSLPLTIGEGLEQMCHIYFIRAPNC